MPYKIMRNEILEDFERYAYITSLLVYESELSVLERADLETLRLKYKFLR